MDKEDKSFTQHRHISLIRIPEARNKIILFVDIGAQQTSLQSYTNTEDASNVRLQIIQANWSASSCVV